MYSGKQSIPKIQVKCDKLLELSEVTVRGDLIPTFFLVCPTVLVKKLKQHQQLKLWLLMRLLVKLSYWNKFLLHSSNTYIYICKYVKAIVIFMSKDLCHALTSKHSIADKFFRTIVSCTRLYFETVIYVFAMISCLLYRADVDTKRNRAHLEAVLQTLETGTLQIYFTNCGFCRRRKSYNWF